MEEKNLILNLDKNKRYVTEIKNFLENSNYENLVITGKGVFQLNGNFETKGSKTILFEKNFEGEIYLYDFNKNNNIYIQIYGKSNYISISNTNIARLSISSKNLSYVNIIEGEIKELQINNSSADNIRIIQLIIDKINIQKSDIHNTIIHSNINKFEIIDCDTKKFNLWYSEIDKLILKSIYNSSNYDFKFDNLKLNNLEIHNSNLGKAIISNTKIENLELKNPVLNETIFNNVEFPKNDIKSAGEENSNNYGEIKEYYIQLKNVMDNSGNHIQADKFFAKEMEYYGKSLKGEKGQFWNKLVYYIQKGISDFGNDWTLPILWMINLGNLNIIFTQKYYFTLFYILIFGFFYYILHTSFGLFKEQSDFKKIIKNILMVFLAFLLFNIFYYFYYKISLYIIFENSIEILNYLDTFANAIKPLDVLNVTSDITFFGLLYKITLAILIYHLIISLKRLTKR